MIDLSQIDPAQPLAPFREVEEELTASDPSLLEKPRLIALNKADAIPADFPLETVTEAYGGLGKRLLVVSALTGAGLAELRQAIAAEVARLEPANTENASPET